MKKKMDYQFASALLLRAPYYSTTDYGLERLTEILEDPAFRDAIWLASPDFYELLEKANFSLQQLNKKAQHSLNKYLNRTHFRPTPFGSFATISMTDWHPDRQIMLGSDQDCRLQTLPSREWNHDLEMALLTAEKDFLVRTNPTLHRIGGRLRYTGYYWNDKGKIHFQVKAIPAEKINLMLTGEAKAEPVLKSSLLEQLLKTADCSQEEAQSYLNFVIQEQVLLAEFTGNLTSRFGWNGPSHQREKYASRGEATAFFQTLFTQNQGRIENLPALYKQLSGKVPLPNGRNVHRNFYVALRRPVTSGGVDVKIKDRLQKAIEVLRRIVPPFTTPNLKKFKEAFGQKFEAQRVPFLTALDPDSGINYGGLYTAGSGQGLLDGLSFPQRTGSLKEQEWSKVHRMFLRIWLDNTLRGAFEPVVIRDEDLEGLEYQFDGYALPPSFPVLFSPADGKLIIESAGGATGTSLIGRFSVFSAEIEQFCREIALAESSANPEVVFAEIHQLSDLHSDNINRRMPLYEHVIHLVTYPEDGTQQHISLNDLLLSLRGDELILESVSLGKRIIPRLPTAYNFHHNELAMFQMLCDLQFQGLQANLNFDPEKLFPGMSYYPRIEYRDTVLSMAKWHLDEQEKAFLLGMPLSIGRLHSFRNRRGMPCKVSLGISDQQLIFNLENDSEALFFLESLREQQRPTVREYLPPDGSVRKGNKVYAGQLIALIQNEQPVYKGIGTIGHQKMPRPRRHFLPGSEWLYLKIYCTPESSNRLLKKAIHPVFVANRGLIDCWFFIRYQDPEPHIRLRIRSSLDGVGHLLRALERKLSQKQHQGFVRALQTDTYQREIERYSPELMEAVELCFQAGSEWVVADLMSGSHSKDRSANFTAFHLIYQMAQVFLNGETELINFFGWRAETFLKEFGDARQLRLDMDHKYRLWRSELATALRGSDTNKTFKKFNPRIPVSIMEIVSEISTKSKNWGEEKRLVLLADLVHMQVNRMYNHLQRQHEALICYALHKYASSQFARSRQAVHAGKKHSD
jgi:thiopeptide-type bacteriocin biosynthesis protein